MSFTYATLKTAIQDYMENDETTFANNLDVFIKDIEEDILKNVELLSYRKNVTGTAASGTPYLGMPSDYLSAFSLAVISSSIYYYLLLKHPSFMRDYTPNASTTGRPKYYAQFDNVTFIIAPTPDEVFEKNIEGGVARVMEILDGGMGGVLLPRELHELIGKELVDVAVNEIDPIKSQMAESMLKRIETGPPNNRSTLLETSKVVDEYYRKRLSTIHTSRAAMLKRRSADAWSKNINTYKTSIITGAVDQFRDSGSTMNPFEYRNAFFAPFKESNIIYDEETGTTMEKRGNSIVFTDIGGNPETLNFDDVKTETDDMVYARAYEEELRDLSIVDKDTGKAKTPYPGQVAMVYAASKVGGPVRPELIHALQNVYEMVDNTRMSGVIPGEEESVKEALRVGIEMYKHLASTGNHHLIERAIPDEGARVFYDSIKIVQEQQYVASSVTGGNTFEDIWPRLIHMKDAIHIAQEKLEAQWDAPQGSSGIGYGDSLIQQHLGEGLYANRFKLLDDVKKTARVLYLMHGQPIETAIEDAVKSRKEQTVEWGGFMVDKNTINKDFIDGKVPIDSQGKIANKIYVPETLEWFLGRSEGIGKDKVRMGLSAIQNLPGMVDAIWGKDGFNTVVPIDVAKERIASMLPNVAASFVQHSTSSYRNVSPKEIFDAAIESFNKYPHLIGKEWTATKASDEKVIGIFRVEGSGGLAYWVGLRNSEAADDEFRLAGKPGTGSPYSYDEIIGFGDFGNKKRHPETLPYHLRPRDGRRAPGFQHPNDILGGLTGQYKIKSDIEGEFEWDLELRKRRLEEMFTERQIENGIRAGTLGTGTGTVIER